VDATRRDSVSFHLTTVRYTSSVSWRMTILRSHLRQTRERSSGTPRRLVFDAFAGERNARATHCNVFVRRADLRISVERNLDGDLVSYSNHPIVGKQFYLFCPDRVECDVAHRLQVMELRRFCSQTIRLPVDIPRSRPSSLTTLMASCSSAAAVRWISRESRL
jgi:hypothetical protein